MITTQEQIEKRITYWRVFRLIFVIFSLYLLWDVFYRWDGFEYHSTFSDFLPSVALVTILWSAVAVFFALMLWLLLRGFERLFQRMKWKVNNESLLMSIVIFVSLVLVVWIGKRFVMKEQLLFVLKLTVMIFIIFVTSLLSWLLRNKSDIIHERITPLVWLFGIWVIISVPIVVYHTGLKQTDNPLLQKKIQSFAADTNLPNIILVTFDTVAALDMSVYGYHRPTTPFIAKWAETASLFTKVEAGSNWTPPTTASLMTGKRGWTHKMFHEYSTPVKSDIESLPLLLRNYGYYNIAFVVNPYCTVKRLGIANSFDIAPPVLEFVESHDLIGWKFGTLNVALTKLFGDKIKFYTWIIDPEFILGKLITAMYYKLITISQTEVPPEIAFKKFAETLDKGIQEPFFAWIHLLPPHIPYMPPDPYIGMFNHTKKLRTYDQQWLGVTENKIYDEEDWGIFRARYDEYLRYCDKTFEDFIVDLSKRDKSKNTIIIFSSDHGESFEHNDFTHGHDYLYEQVTHIPLIIKEPGQNKGTVINDLVEQIDIPPTILSLANIQIPSWMEGRSLKPLMHSEMLPSKPAFSMTFLKNPGRGHKITKGTIAVWEGDYKLIHYLVEGKSLLFNIKEDPGELKNLFDEKKEIGQHLLALIQDNLKKANEKISMGE